MKARFVEKAAFFVALTGAGSMIGSVIDMSSQQSKYNGQVADFREQFDQQPYDGTPIMTNEDVATAQAQVDAEFESYLQNSPDAPEKPQNERDFLLVAGGGVAFLGATIVGVSKLGNK